MNSNGENIGQTGENLHPKLSWLTEYRKLDDKDKAILKSRLFGVSVNGWEITEARFKKWAEGRQIPSLDEAKLIIGKLNEIKKEIEDLPKLVRA